MATVKIATDRLKLEEKCWRVRLSVNKYAWLPLSQITETREGMINAPHNPFTDKIPCKVLTIKNWIFNKKESELEMLGDKFEIISR